MRVLVILFNVLERIQKENTLNPVFSIDQYCILRGIRAAL
jgi:hypothetical protein